MNSSAEAEVGAAVGAGLGEKEGNNGVGTSESRGVGTCATNGVGKGVGNGVGRYVVGDGVDSSGSRTGASVVGHLLQLRGHWSHAQFGSNPLLPSHAPFSSINAHAWLRSSQSRGLDDSGAGNASLTGRVWGAGVGLPVGRTVSVGVGESVGTGVDGKRVELERWVDVWGQVWRGRGKEPASWATVWEQVSLGEE